MKKYLVTIIVIICIAIAIFIVYFFVKSNKSNRYTNDIQTTSTESKSTPSQKQSSDPKKENDTYLSIPINEFSSRITKKPFGIYITPENSPVNPERFSGYHTGIDIEYEDVDYDVPVYAVNDSKVIYSGYISGYGGVAILKSNIEGSYRSILYGHLDPNSLPKVGDSFKKSDQIAILGEGYTEETNSERRHLHFAILSDDRIDFKGYVDNKIDLENWIDPQSIEYSEK